MDWFAPLPSLLLFGPLLVVLWLAQRRSVHPMSAGRRRALTAVRGGMVLVLLAALAGPALHRTTRRESILFVLDHSRSQGERALLEAADRAGRLLEDYRERRGEVPAGFVSAGQQPRLLSKPDDRASEVSPDVTLIEKDGSQTNLSRALEFAGGLFPAGVSRRVVLLTDGMETRGDVESAAREAAASGMVVDCVPVAGRRRPDVRVVGLDTGRSRLHVGATLRLSAEVESSISGEGRIRLFENGIEVASRPLALEAGERRTLDFERAPEQKNFYNYRVRVEGFDGDSIPENDEAMALVDVRGRPRILYVEGQTREAHYLAGAMHEEGLRMEVRPPDALPDVPQGLAGYDAVILSDVPAYELTEAAMGAVRDYVEKLGGGFLMIGGKESFGVGGYYRTPIEEILPVKMIPPDIEERAARALALVIDRSGSMNGQKIEICKSAAIGTLDLLDSKDYITVVCFDSSARSVVPPTRLTSPGSVKAQISTINAGGGTNIHPGMSTAWEGIRGVEAKIKHMIVLSDGQTGGGDYQNLAGSISADGITISTIAVGRRADRALLQRIAAAGGGKFYQTVDPGNIPRIFTRDTMVHTGRLIREEAFSPKKVERHPMLEGWPVRKAPRLLGYVKTDPRATSQVPLVTHTGDPLLAHWRFGLGKVSAFTSGCRSRWASLWLTGWQEGYNQLWAQILRETARRPEGRLMDIRLSERSGRAQITVDVLENAAEFKNEAEVEADVFFAPAESLGGGMKEFDHASLHQVGPGRYSGEFQPDQPGVYLVRARSGASLVSAGLVHDISRETAGGRINMPLLRSVSSLTGGAVLDSPEADLPPLDSTRSHAVDLTPLLLRLLLCLFVADVLLRRWENALGVAQWARRAWKKIAPFLPGT